MADKGIVVADSETGESVGCVDLQKQDNDSNNRIVQLVSGVTVSSPLYPWTGDTNQLRDVIFGSNVPGNIIAASNGDTEDDLFNLNSGITNNKFDVRDTSAVMLYGAFFADSTDVDTVNGVSIKVTPLLFPDSGNVPATLLQQTALRWNLKNPLSVAGTYDGDDDGTTSIYGQTYFTYAGASYDTCHPFIPVVWPTYGSYNVGFHVRSSKSIVGFLRIYATALTGQIANIALADSHIRDKELSSAFFKTYN